MPDDSVKASLLLRVIAKVLDFIVIAAAAEAIHRVGYFAGIVYLLIGDGLFNGSSPGKKLVRLKVVSLSTGDTATFRDSIVRNAAFAAALLIYKIPIVGWFFAAVILAMEFLLMLGNKDGMRLGDDMANTKVIEG